MQDAKLISQLKTLLAQGKDEEVFSSLKASLKDKKQEESFNEVVVLERNLFDLKENHRKGLVAPIDFQTQKNRIYHALISLIDTLNREPILPNPPIAGSKKSKLPYVIGTVIVGIAVLFFVRMSLGKPNLVAQPTESQEIIDEALEEAVDEEAQMLKPTPKRKEEVSEDKPATAFDLSGRWRLEGQWGVVVEFSQSGEKVDFQLKNNDRLLYDGNGTVLKDDVVINFEWTNGKGVYELEAKENGIVLEGLIKNALNNYEGEKVIFRKIID